MSSEIVIGFIGEDPSPLLHESISEFPNNVVLIQSRRFDAAQFAVELLVIVIPTLIPAISKVLRTYLNAKNSVRIRTDKIDMEGVTATDAIRILQELAQESSPEINAEESGS
jgi:hypothetical protein